MSRTYRKSRDDVKYMEGQYGNLRVWKCKGPCCTDGRNHRDKKWEMAADEQIKAVENGNDSYFGSWYEGMQGEEKLQRYWENQWRLNTQSRELLEEAA